ncbi:hypothetical protein [Fortiea sp. LEGE XX443]
MRRCAAACGHTSLTLYKSPDTRLFEKVGYLVIDEAIASIM